MTSLGVSRPDRTGQSVLRSVGHLNGLVLGVEGMERYHGSENFLRGRARGVAEAFDDGRAQKSALLRHTLNGGIAGGPAGENTPTLFDSESNVRLHLVTMVVRNDRTHAGLFLIRVADRDAFDGFDKFRFEGFVNRGVHQDA